MEKYAVEAQYARRPAAKASAKAYEAKIQAQEMAAEAAQQKVEAEARAHVTAVQAEARVQQEVLQNGASARLQQAAKEVRAKEQASLAEQESQEVAAENERFRKATVDQNCQLLCLKLGFVCLSCLLSGGLACILSFNGTFLHLDHLVSNHFDLILC